MDKNKIKLHLKTFIKEESIPGVEVTEKAKKESGKENKKALKDVEKKMGEYDKAATKKSNDATKKFNYTDKKEENYHEEVEIMNGQEMVEYDREPNEDFKERALAAIKGDPKMGNGPGANAEATWGASSDSFGADLVKSIKASKKKRDEEDVKWDGMGDVAQNLGKNKNPRKIAVENKVVKPPKQLGENKTEELGGGYTHFAIFKSNNKIADGWEYEDLDVESIKHYSKVDLTDEYPDNKPSDFTILTRKTLQKRGINPSDSNNWYKVSGDITETNKKDIKESKMKRLKFKNPFNGVGNALQLIPEGYRVDKKVFEMTDGNENYRMRWEGTLEEGRAVVLMASDKTLVNEDMEKMKHLMGYKSENTLGLLKGAERIDENKSFREVWDKTKALLTESDEENLNENGAASGSMGFSGEGNLSEEEVAENVGGHAEHIMKEDEVNEDEVNEDEVNEDEVNECEKDRFDEIFEGYDTVVEEELSEDSVTEELSPEQSAEMDTDKDGDIDSKDLKNLRDK